jgi:sulfopyruvate decarboxylase alpha subunit
MGWAETLVQSLKETNTTLIAYVPDINIARATSLMEEDPFFRVVSATREEEAIGIAVGAYAVGQYSAVFMQSSGFGNTINAVASLCIPCRTPVPLFINLRGDLGEFNIAQGAMGRATRPIMDILGITHYTLNDEHRMDTVVKGAVALCRASRQPVAICLTPLLHGGKSV